MTTELALADGEDEALSPAASDLWRALKRDAGHANGTPAGCVLTGISFLKLIGAS